MKRYIKPNIEVVAVESAQLICYSLGINDMETGEQWSREDNNFFEENNLPKMY
jgi:hypothetical protein